jgi:hypothetical protein
MFVVDQMITPYIKLSPTLLVSSLLFVQERVYRSLIL